MQYLSGESFLNELYTDMHKEKVVMHNSKNCDTPEEKIARYVNRLENIHNKARDCNKIDMLKHYYYDKYIIKELPADYSDSGDEKLYEIQSKQKEILDNWIFYLMSSENNYPMWFKNYVFQGMVEANNKILESQHDNFLELNEEALSSVYDVVYDYVEGIQLTSEQQHAIENGKTFGPIYIYYLNTINERKKNQEKHKDNFISKKAKKHSLLKSLFKL